MGQTHQNGGRPYKCKIQSIFKRNSRVKSDKIEKINRATTRKTVQTSADDIVSAYQASSVQIG